MVGTKALPIIPEKRHRAKIINPLRGERYAKLFFFIHLSTTAKQCTNKLTCSFFRVSITPAQHPLMDFLRLERVFVKFYLLNGGRTALPALC